MRTNLFDEARTALAERQFALLSAGLDRVFAENRFFAGRYAAAGLTRAHVRSWDDFRRLPTVDKADLVADQDAEPPYGRRIAPPVARYTRLHQSSGTSGGKPLRWLDTPESWNWLLGAWETILPAMGVAPADRLFFTFSFGPFLGFWAAFEAAQRQGLFVAAGGGLSTVARLRLLLENDAAFVFCTPTYALRLAEVAASEGVDLRNSAVRGVVLAGEPGGNVPATRRRLEDAWGARVFDHSGMTEVGPMTAEYVAAPCKLFLLEERYIVEFLEPGGADPVHEGELGEMVVTNLGRWDNPVVRYRTGDLVRWRHSPVRESWSDDLPPWVHLEGGVLARADEMLWIKGNNVYPAAVETVLREFAEVAEYLVEAVDATDGVRLELTIEPLPNHADDPKLAERVAAAVQDRLFFRPARVRLVAPGSLPRYEMKARRFLRRPHGT
ncbi:MAG: phenylacetate--CoA ligase family protein [Planctomycetia bacterium]